ncbi:hypothetical protein EVAR_82738_1 [Eumeta japonica]|uniref:Uncharacterized protein n=1 Tax=Eumeta variegata TaxID=151549 RepID=A0A4C1ZNS5_EUMVA|nr:hypothetical protein EVAR_82738_1 [Eumeta japonica]
MEKLKGGIFDCSQIRRLKKEADFMKAMSVPDSEKRAGEQNQESRPGGIEIIDTKLSVKIKNVTGTGMKCSTEIRIESRTGIRLENGMAIAEDDSPSFNPVMSPVNERWKYGRGMPLTRRRAAAPGHVARRGSPANSSNFRNTRHQRARRPRPNFITMPSPAIRIDNLLFFVVYLTSKSSRRRRSRTKSPPGIRKVLNGRELRLSYLSLDRCSNEMLTESAGCTGSEQATSLAEPIAPGEETFAGGITRWNGLSLDGWDLVKLVGSWAS